MFIVGTQHTHAQRSRYFSFLKNGDNIDDRKLWTLFYAIRKLNDQFSKFHN